MKNIFLITFFLLYSPKAHTMQHWTHSSNSTSYMFAPGVMASETHLANYCPFFIASTGEHVTGKKGIEVIKAPVTTTNLAEINLKPISKTKKKRSFDDVMVGPLKAVGYLGSYLAHRFYGITVTPPPENKSDFSVEAHWINPSKINLAQDDDLSIFKNSYENHVAATSHHQPTNVVLYGVSRGSATVFNFIALHQPIHVRAAICEGIYDSVPQVKQAYGPRSLMGKFKIKLLALTKFNPNGTAPIKNVDAIPSDFPLLLVTSLKDSLVPSACTINLYKQLKDTGHTNVHLLVLKNSAHPLYTCHNQEDRTLYETVVHAFYRAYNLPHIPALADQGQHYYQYESQPSAEKADEYLIAKKSRSPKKP